MGDVVRGEDSSSQNANSVSRCERGADGRVQVHLADGSSFFVSADFADGCSLRPGLYVSEELEAAIRADAEKLEAWRKGLELLGRREHTAFELERKLKSRGFGGEAVTAALTTLRGAGYLDDRRYAEAWTRYRLKRRPEGRSHLAAGLARHGVSRDLIESVLQEMFTEEEAKAALARAAEKILKKRNMDELSLIKYLTGRGFPYRKVKIYLEQIQSTG